MPEQEGSTAPSVSPAQAALGVVGTVPIMVPYVAAGLALGAGAQLFAGFLFALYWMVIKSTAPEEFWPTLLGFLGGLATGYLLFALPPLLGTAGYVIAGAVIVLALFLFNLGAAKLVVNPAYLLMLTLGTSVVIFRSDADYIGAAIAILLAGAYAGGMMALVGWIVKSRKRAVPA